MKILKGAAHAGPRVRGYCKHVYSGSRPALPRWRFAKTALFQHAVPYDPPLPADPTGDRDALTGLGDDGDLEGHVGPILPRRRHDADRRRGPDGHHQRFRGLDALDFQLLRDPDDPLEQIDLDGHLHQDLRQRTRRRDDPADEAVCLREHRIEVRPDRDQPARTDLLPGGPARVEGPDRRREVLPFRLVPECHLAPGRDLDLFPDLHAALHQAPAEHAADDLLRPDPRLVHVERAGHVHLRGLRLLAGPRRDDLLNHHHQDVEVHIVVGRHRDDRPPLRDGPLGERLDLAVVLLRLLRVHDIDLVLHDHDLVDADDPEGHQVLLRLRLRDILVRRDHEEGAVHDRRAAQHRRHERLMSGGIDEGHDPLELPLHVVGLAHLRVLVRGGLVVLRTLVDRHVRVAESDRDAPLDLLAVPVRPLPGEPLRQRGLPMVHVPDDADVHLRLARNLHRACSCHASSIDFGPRTTIFRFNCRMSGDTVFPRTVFFFRIPGRTGWNPTPPLTSRPFLRGPGRSCRMGNPSLSLPPVIWSLYPGRPTYSPSRSSPIFLPIRAFA